MEIPEKLKNMKKDKKMLTAVTILGITGLFLIMISSIIPEKKQQDESISQPQRTMTDAESYCFETEKRLEGFLKNIYGVGDVKVYLTVGSDERYIYATEGKRSRTDEKSEEEEKYVIVGSGSDKSALIETIEIPEIEGVVVACTGCDSPVVQEQIYKAVAAALGISTGKIYVTKLK